MSPCWTTEDIVMTSILPPLKIQTIFLPLQFNCFNADTVSRPEFSTTILWFSTISKKLTIKSWSSTVIISSTFFWIYGKMLCPGVFTAVPSAMVLTFGKETTFPCFNDSCIQFAPAGSTPMTLIFGFNNLASVETPHNKPPPPTGAKIISTVGSSLIISMAMEPCPVATTSSSNGWMKVYPFSSANCKA